MKADPHPETMTTAITSELYVKNDLCVANNGLTKHAIGIYGIYDLACDSQTSNEKACTFGITVYCRISCEFGNSRDNEKISDALCAATFPGKYGGNGTFKSNKDGKSLTTIDVKIGRQ